MNIPHSQSPSLKMIPKESLSLKQTQRLIMSPQMQQAIHLLQASSMELAELLVNEIEQNPVLENGDFENNYDDDLESMEEEVREAEVDYNTSLQTELEFSDRDLEIFRHLDDEIKEHFDESLNFTKKRTNDEDKLKTYLESSVEKQMSLFEFLMNQAQQNFHDRKDLEIAEFIIGNLDINGFLTLSIKELQVLSHFTEQELLDTLAKIQGFEPLGIGAKNLQECLLLQLKAKGSQPTDLSYRLVQDCFDDLLHKRLQKIQKTLNCSFDDLTQLIQQIGKLNFYPGKQFNLPVTTYITPDVTVSQEENEQLSVKINEEYLPTLRLNSRYLKMLQDPALKGEVRDFIKSKVVSAKWLLRNIFQRQTTIERIVHFLCDWNPEFFLEQDGKLKPLTMKTVAEALELHESTIARAISNKYVQCARGLLPLRSFFTNAYHTTEGDDISSQTVKDALIEIIKGENKRKPLSDHKLSDALKEKGIDCARRTIAKYRAELQILNAHQRREFADP